MGTRCTRQLKQILHDIVHDRRAEIVEMEVISDHAHLLVEVDPQYGILRLIKQMKGRSSHILRARTRSLRLRPPTLLTHRYFVATTGTAPRAVIKRYIEQQRHV